MRTKIFIAIAIAMIGQVAFAQDSFDASVANVLLLQNSAVQKSVGVSTAQRQNMEKVAAKYNASKKEFLTSEQKRNAKEGKSYKPDRQTYDAMFAGFRGVILRLLTSAQLKRLREITLQEVGMVSLLEDHVAGKVGISSSQLKQLRASYESGAKNADDIERRAVTPIQAKYKDKKATNDAGRKQLAAAFDKDMEAAARGAKPKLDQIKAQTRSEFRKILTAKQQAIWKDLQGKPI